MMRRRAPTRVMLVLVLVAGLSVIPGALTMPAHAYPSVLMPTSGAYFGAFVDPRGSETKQQAVQRLEGKIGRNLKIDHYYAKWNSPIPMAPQVWDKSTGRIPFVNWNSAKNDGTYVRWSAIANGSQDAWIRARADAFSAFASPIYLCFHHEPEDELATLGTPAEYAAAFRHIVTIFRQRNVTNVAFVWTMMAWTFDARSGRNPMDYYPGDGYVDFVGVDGYNWYGVRPGELWRPFSDVFAAARAFALGRAKPWMVVEYGTIEDNLVPGRKAQWIRDVLPAAQAWPDLKAVLYFDSLRGGHYWATDSSSSSISAFRTLGQAPYFNGVGGTTSPSAPPGTTLQNTLNAGPAGASITTSASANGGDMFSDVVASGSSTLTYDNAHARGAYAARHALTSGGDSYYQWNGNLIQWFGRVYLWMGSDPPGAIRLVRVLSGSSMESAIDILASGAIRVVDSSNSSIASSLSTVATGQWVRIEWSIDQASGRVEVRLFNDADSTSPTATVASAAGESIGSSTEQIQIGRSGSQSFAFAFWTDDPSVTTQGFPGPS